MGASSSLGFGKPQKALQVWRELFLCASAVDLACRFGEKVLAKNLALTFPEVKKNELINIRFGVRVWLAAKPEEK